MPLTLQSQLMENVLVIRCHGRIVAGAEVNALQAEMDKHAELRKKVVLNLADVDYIDSSGLGALVRAYGTLRSAGGSLQLCQVSRAVHQVLEVTHLLGVLPPHSSEREAIEAFDQPSPDEVVGSRPGILCIDSSKDLLAYLRALLTNSGYEVHTAWNLADARQMVSFMKPKLLICGAGILELPAAAAAIERFRQSGPDIQVLNLPSDFSTAEAGQAGTDLVDSVRSLLTT
jgi:anti-sigma B factor antagonist